MIYTEVEKDLFTMDNSYVQAHCISRDCKLGAGIAKTFRNKYPKMPETVKEKVQERTKNNENTIGIAVAYEENNQIVYNLITKNMYYNKPSYDTLRASLEKLKSSMIQRNEVKLAIPQIGSGLDKLKWDRVRDIIHEVFGDTDIEIVVCIYKK